VNPQIGALFVQVAYIAASAAFILGLRGLTKPDTARRGMQLAAAGMLLAIIGTLLNHEIITKVPPLLHTPLMAATNAISAISLVASIVIAGSERPLYINIMGAIAVAAATVNVVGGFVITDRMLKMFKKTEAPK